MFTFASRTFVIAMAAALIGRSLTASDVVDKIDDALLGKLQGEWSPTSSVFDGKPFTSAAGESTVVFEGRTMSIRFGDKVAGRLDIKHLVTNGELGHIDYEIVDPAGKTVRTKQLFKLDGDTLTTCVRSPPGERPDELTSKPGSKYLLTVLQRKKRKSTNGDEEDLQGLWQAVSLEANGKKAPDEQINEVQLLFKGDKVVFNPKHENREHTYKIDPKAKPKAMDITPGDGQKKGQKMPLAIYDLVGDKLIICIDKEGTHGKRPTEFKTEAGDGLGLITLEKVKQTK